MLKQFEGKGLDYDFVDCVIGKDLTDEELAERCDLNRIRELNKDVEWISRGIIGCSLTSQKIHREIVERGLKAGMLLEDDVSIPGNFSSILSECESAIEPGDVILLFWMSWEPIRFINESRIELDNVTLYETADLHRVTGGSATIFSREAAAKMVEFNTPIRITPDCWSDFAAEGCFNRVLCAYPPVVDTADLMSTMEQGPLVGLRQVINKYRIFPIYQALKYRRRRSKRDRQSATVV